MCWFHIMQAVKKPDIKRLIPTSNYEDVLNDIRYLHFSLELEFDTRKREILNKWKANTSLNQFCTYFKEQWLKG